MSVFLASEHVGSFLSNKFRRILGFYVVLERALSASWVAIPTSSAPYPTSANTYMCSADVDGMYENAKRITGAWYVAYTCTFLS